MSKPTKSQFIKLVAEKSGKSQTDVKDVLDSLETAIAAAYDEGHDGVVIGDLVQLNKVDVPEREHRNPHTGEKFTKEAHQAIKAKLTSKGKGLA